MRVEEMRVEEMRGLAHGVTFSIRQQGRAKRTYEGGVPSLRTVQSGAAAVYACEGEVNGAWAHGRCKAEETREKRRAQRAGGRLRESSNTTPTTLDRSRCGSA
ncbi:hypothetical protein GCM10010449_72450 [Streptomyces rectiviolaceus]|uniref:Transposase n=1 Tax=Streptomyces rectiviolaceus TaxID=332591 RepID=A0ABP6NAW9_9ACTN